MRMSSHTLIASRDANVIAYTDRIASRDANLIAYTDRIASRDVNLIAYTDRVALSILSYELSVLLSISLDPHE